MTKKDFEFLASQIAYAVARYGKNVGPSNPLHALCWFAEDLATDLGDANTRFDRARFLSACKLPADY